MRTRSCAVGLLALLGAFGLVAVTSPALAAPKKKKAAAAEEKKAEEAPADEEKSVDDLMMESGTTKKKPASSDESTTASESSAEEEEAFTEPDAWERPPKEEEKPKPAPVVKAEEKYGDGRRIEIALAPVYGFNVGDAFWTTLNPYGLGLGIRGGYELDFKMFLGAGFVYHLGGSDRRSVNTPGAPTPQISDVTQNYMLAYVEVGYDFWFDTLLLRPSLWLGMGFAIVDPYLNTGGVKTVQDFMFAPGLNVIFPLDGWFIGADARYVSVTADGAQGLDLFGVIGLRFE